MHPMKIKGCFIFILALVKNIFQKHCYGLPTKGNMMMLLACPLAPGWSVTQLKNPVVCHSNSFIINDWDIGSIGSSMTSQIKSFKHNFLKRKITCYISKGHHTILGSRLTNQQKELKSAGQCA